MLKSDYLISVDLFGSGMAEKPWLKPKLGSRSDEAV
jgi:hypothetical protein